MARRLFLKWSRRSEHKAKVMRALKLIRLAERPLVMYSGGKDSSVVAHLTARVHKSFVVFHWDYGDALMPRSYEREALLMLADLLADSSPMVVLAKRPHAFEAREIGAQGIGYRAFWGNVSKVIKEFNIKTVISALRAEESIRRSIMTKNIIGEVLKVPNFHVIRDWSWLDVFAYLTSNRLPWHSHYDVRGPLEGWEEVRFVTFFDKEFEHLGTTLVDGVTMPWFRWVKR